MSTCPQARLYATQLEVKICVIGLCKVETILAWDPSKQKNPFSKPPFDNDLPMCNAMLCW
jgi:hypothetical protein